MTSNGNKSGWMLTAGCCSGIISFLLLVALSSWIGIPGELNQGVTLLLSIILAIRIGWMVYSKRLDGSYSRRSQRKFRRWTSAFALVIAANTTVHLLFAESIESTTVKGLIEVFIFWGLGALLFFKWDLALVKEPSFDPHDAVVLYAAISAGEKGITIGQLCRFSEVRYSPDTEKPSDDGVVLGRIFNKYHDSDDRGPAIEHSLWKLVRAGYLHPKVNEFQTFQMTPKGFSDCAALTWETTVIAGIGALSNHLENEGALD